MVDLLLCNAQAFIKLWIQIPEGCEMIPFELECYYTLLDRISRSDFRRRVIEDNSTKILYQIFSIAEQVSVGCSKLGDDMSNILALNSNKPEKVNVKLLYSVATNFQQNMATLDAFVSGAGAQDTQLFTNSPAHQHLRNMELEKTVASLGLPGSQRRKYKLCN